MANSEHLAKLKEGVEAWNDWREANTEIVPDLSGADLVQAALIGADLSKADLSGASLVGAILHGAVLLPADHGLILIAKHLSADLHGACLGKAGLRLANLREADLGWADLREADLGWADLSEADLSRTDLTGANLSGADLTTAYLGYTTFGDNDLSDVKGLETVRHEGPSTIGIDTIYRSQGKIPLAFLRGGRSARQLHRVHGLPHREGP